MFPNLIEKSAVSSMTWLNLCAPDVRSSIQGCSLANWKRPLQSNYAKRRKACVVNGCGGRQKAAGLCWVKSCQSGDRRNFTFYILHAETESDSASKGLISVFSPWMWVETEVFRLKRNGEKKKICLQRKCDNSTHKRAEGDNTIASWAKNAGSRKEFEKIIKRED